MELARDRQLRNYTTLQLGGPAAQWVTADSDAQVEEALRHATSEGVPLRVLGGGSNLVVADDGVDGVVLHMATRGLRVERDHDVVRVHAAAGEPWQHVVDLALDEQLAGVECLTGIPGCTGATPIQNVGAYGQEVGQVVESVRVLDRQDLSQRPWSTEECAFAYRDSAFKRAPDRYIVLSVCFALRPGGAPALRYAELQRAMDPRTTTPTLREVADTVYRLRAGKSMVLDPHDPNHRSAGSFFTNPIVSAECAADVVSRATAAGLVQQARDVPTFSAPDGQVKLAAGWLIEKAGFKKGTRRGAVGISTKHALGLVHHGGGTTSQLLTLAREVRDVVRAQFGVTLHPEPTLWGLQWESACPTP